MTGRDLINGSLRLLGVLAQGEACDATEAGDALRSLNGMLDSWSIESLMVISQVQHVVTLATSKPVYTVGPGADIDVPRPLKFNDLSFLDSSGAQTVFLPVLQYTQAQYASLAVIELGTAYPQAYFFDGGFTLGNLYIYPTPQAGMKLRFWSQEALSSIPSINATLNLAPGYEKAMSYNLALELAPEYGKEPSGLVTSQAMTAKQNVERLNARDVALILDTVPSNNCYNHGNIFTGV